MKKGHSEYRYLLTGFFIQIMNFFIISSSMLHFSGVSLEGELFYKEQRHLPKRNLPLSIINLALFFSKTFYFFNLGHLVN